MTVLFRYVDLEMDEEAYIRFLVTHQQELNLPYSYALTLSYIASPLLYGKAMLAMDEDAYEVVAATGFVIGTGANDYEDRHVCQIETVYLADEYSCSSLLCQGLQALCTLIRQEYEAVTLIQFWVSADEQSLNGLLPRLLALPGASRSVVGQLALCVVPFKELETYIGRLKKMVT